MIETIAALNKLLSLLCSHFVVELIVSAAAAAAAAELATVVEMMGDATAATASTILSLMMGLLVGLPRMFDGIGNSDRRSTSFAIEMA